MVYNVYGNTMVGVTLGPHESWPSPWENPGYATVSAPTVFFIFIFLGYQLWEACRVLLLRSNNFDDWPSSIAKRCMLSMTNIIK